MRKTTIPMIKVTGIKNITSGISIIIGRFYHFKSTSVKLGDSGQIGHSAKILIQISTNYFRLKMWRVV